MKEPSSDASKSRMNDAFYRSLSKRAASEESASDIMLIMYQLPLEEVIENYNGFQIESDDAPLFPGIQTLAALALKNFLENIQTAFNTCHSPIERMFLSALLAASDATGYSVTVKSPTNSKISSIQEETYNLGLQYNPRLSIQLQAKLGQYHVDFILTQTLIVPDFDNPQSLTEAMADETGVKENPGAIEIIKNLIVECDGHEFHDRTKEQASRDRERDRRLQKLGYPVFRYTGADIWGDVFKCALDALKSLDDMTNEAAYG